MKPYLRMNNQNTYASSSIQMAAQGFDLLNINYQKYKTIDEIPVKAECMPVGFVSEVTSQLLRLGIKAPDIDYPPQLKPWLRREISRTTIEYAELYMLENPSQRYFIKPVKDKLFDAIFVDYINDLKRISHLPKETEIWISPYLNLTTEYRCYIATTGNQKRCIGIYRYRGYDNIYPKMNEINEMIKAYDTSPACYSLDVAIDSNQNLCLVEINDAYSIQNYGLSPEDYVKWLMIRWCELTEINISAEFFFSEFM